MKSFYLIIIFVITFTTCTHAQDQTKTHPDSSSSANPKITYEAWREEVKSDSRLSPKFGDAVKSKSQKEADQRLIADYIKQEGSRRKGSETLVKLGFDFLYEGNIRTAMYRFNQAWLLDPENENVFWGFAAVYFNFGDFENAMKQLDEGLVLNPESSNIITDQATIHLVHFQTKKDEKELSTALRLFTKSYIIDAKNQNTLFKLSVVYFLKGDCYNALKYYHECKALGGNPLTREYIQAIEKNCAGK